jgi:hypothetical protein
MTDFFDELVQDVVQGALWQTEAGVALVVGSAPPVPDGTWLAEGELIVRYAIPLLGQPQFAVVPARFVSERGAVLSGWEAWDFAQGNYQLYPRSEIFGLRSDGETAQVFLRELDFGADQRVLVYAALEACAPLARVNALIVGKGEAVPDLLLELLPPPPTG